MGGSGEVYEEFYGLNRLPFGTAPDPRALYWSDDHADAFAMLRYAILSRASVTCLTGEAGTGKTTLVNRLAGELPEEVVLARIPPAAARRGEPLDWLLTALGEAAGDGAPAERHARFRDSVLRIAAAGGRVLLLFDEAQALRPGALEELRLLAGFEEPGESPLQMLLVGQPPLRERLDRPECAALAQRVAADFRLGPLEVDETVEYITWRLLAAGAERPIFAAGAARLVHEATGGVPRLVNILCDLALVCGFAESSETIDQALIRQVLGDARRRGTFGRFAPLTQAPVLVRQES